MKTQTANELSGRAIGSMFFAFFGAFWLTGSLAVTQMLSVTTGAGVLLGMTALLLAAIYLGRQAKHWPRLPDDPAVGRAFGWVNAVQWTAGGVIAFTLGRLHLAVYIPTAIATIVGLHMFPLARLFRYPLHYVTGALMVVWVTGAAFLVPVGSLQGVTMLGAGAILWLSAVVTLTRGIHNARRPFVAGSTARTSQEAA